MTYQLRNVVVAVVLGLLAAVLTALYVTNYRKHVQHGAQSVGVLVATVDIPSGTSGSSIVAEHLLKTVTVPRDALIPGAISSPDQITRLVSTDEILSGEQVSTRRFGNSQELGVRAQLKGTLRAIQVSAANPNQVLAGTLRAGDHVDLVANIKNENNPQFHYDRIVLRDLLVLRAPAPVDTKAGSIANAATESVMLAVRDSQSAKFYFAVKNADPNSSSDGGWALELRPVTSAADSSTDVQSWKTEVFDGLSAAAKAHVLNGDGVNTIGGQG
ncbi:MAG TPA: RcpC/CpaB family pilus assembly protein [Gaiellaceae bacterium]|nr:RcpC/CpaB family pilus assembly protein [Gaiellaceae bacterium]